MKKLAIIAFLSLSFRFYNAKAQEDALTFDAGFIGDLVSNFNGGIKTGTTSLGLIQLSAGLNTENARMWKGGEFLVQAHSFVGNSPTEDLIGDAQVASNIDGATNRFLYQFWYKQNIGKLTILGGLHNLNDAFVITENADIFLNSSFGITPTLSINNAISIFPATTLGGYVQWDSKYFSFVGGIYNYNHTYTSENKFHFADHNFSEGYYSIAESQFRILKDDFKFMEIKLGANYRRCSNDHSHNTEDCYSKDNFSMYLLSDVNLFRSKESDKTAGLFLQCGYSPKDNTPTPLYYAVGTKLGKILCPKLQDELGLAFATAKVNIFDENTSSYKFYKNESLVEITYKLQIHEHIAIQPDIQYILNPAGNDIAKNALVGFLRTEISF
jgi:porin